MSSSRDSQDDSQDSKDPQDSKEPKDSRDVPTIEKKLVIHRGPRSLPGDVEERRSQGPSIKSSHPSPGRPAPGSHGWSSHWSGQRSGQDSRVLPQSSREATDGDEAAWLALIEQIAQGSDLAFERLWRALEPTIDAAARNPRLMHKLADRPAERADCKQTVALKLRRVVPTFLAYREEKVQRGLSPSLVRWLGVIINNTVIDFRRKHPEYQRALGDAERDRRWRSFVYLDSDDESGEGIRSDDHLTERDRALTELSRARQARRMLTWAEENMPPAQLAALLRWLQAEESRQSKQARAALRRLRERFRTEGRQTR